MAMLKGLIQDLAGFRRSRAILSGGEPTMSPAFFPTVSMLAEKGIPSIVITNGVALETTGGWLQEVDELTFSIDTTCRETYLRLRGVDRLDKVMNSLSSAIEESQRAGGRPTVSVNIVLSRPVLKKLDETIRRLIITGVRRFYFLQFETHIDYGCDLAPTQRDWEAFFASTHPRVVATLAAEGLAVPWWVFRPTDGPSTKIHSPCIVPWFHVVIRPNGEVYPCCRLGDDGAEECRDLRFRLGDLGEDRFGAIVRGVKAHTVRQALLRHPPEPCHNCDLGTICSFESLAGEESKKAGVLPRRTLEYPEYIKV
jgi:radical SAM protein with 4Fe4S-binding SPASM domain